MIDIGPESVCSLDLGPQRIEGGVFQVDHVVATGADEVVVGHRIDHLEPAHAVAEEVRLSAPAPDLFSDADRAGTALAPQPPLEAEVACAFTPVACLERRP